MIVFDVVQDSKRDRLREIRVKGHADYDEPGQDIVCAAVSILVYNTINSCEKFCGLDLDVVDIGKELICKIPEGKLSEGAVVLLQSLVFGVEQLSDQYPENVKVIFHQ